MRNWTKIEIKYLKCNYQRSSAERCAVALNRSVHSVTHKVERLSLQKPKAKVSIERFEKITDPVIAYFLGLLWADGGIYGYTVNLTLLETDMREVLPLLRSFGDWSTYLRKPKKRSWRRTVIARVSNCALRRFLLANDYAEKRKRSPTRILAHMPKKLHSLFWRGFFDGDGCLYLHTKRNWKHGHIAFAGHFKQSWSDLERLLISMGVHYHVSRSISKKGHKSSHLVISYKEGLSKTGHYLFRSRVKDGIGLSRKYEKFKIFFSWFTHK